METQETLTLELTVDELKVILVGLREVPYKYSKVLIERLAKTLKEQAVPKEQVNGPVV